MLTSHAPHQGRYMVTGLVCRRGVLSNDPKLVRSIGGFKSLLQGDHLGVEFALESHISVLRRSSLLVDSETILRHRPFPQGPCWQRLVIDDFCAISCEPDGSTEKPLSVARLEAAEDAYAGEGIVGSDEKTVRGARSFKVLELKCSHEIRFEEQGLSQSVRH